MSEPSNTTDGAGTLERRLRLRALFWEYRHLLALGCLLVLGFGAWTSYGVYAAPAETTEQRPVSEWTATGAFSHGATVTESNAIYDEGTVLEGEPIYYTAITPTIDGTYVAGYDAETEDDVEITLTATVQYGAVDPDEETVYWSEREVLAQKRTTDVSPGEEVAMTFDLDVPAIEDQIEAVEHDLQATPGQTDVFVELEREITGTIDGHPESVTDRAVVTVDLEGNTYRIDDDVPFDERHGHQETVTVPASYGPVRSVGGPLAIVLGLVGFAGVALASRRTSPPTAAEREWLAYRADLDAVGDLVVEARLPDANAGDTRAAVSDLESLAGVGMDVGSVLVYDPDDDQYVVEASDRRYVFEPPGLEGVVAGASDSETGAFGWRRTGEAEDTSADAPRDGGEGVSEGEDEDGDDDAETGSQTDANVSGGQAVIYAESARVTEMPAPTETTESKDPTDESGTAADVNRVSADRDGVDSRRQLDPGIACLAGVGEESQPHDTAQKRSSENCSRS